MEFDNTVGPDFYFDNKSDLMSGLRAAFGKDIDLVTRKSIQNSFFLREVTATEELLYVA